MPSNKDKIQSPRKHVRRRGVARIDVVANQTVIEKWLDDQFNAEAIYNGLIDNKLIDGSYSYRTFLRALYDLIPKSRANSSRPSTTRDTSVIVKEPPRSSEKATTVRKEAQGSNSQVVKSGMSTFAIPSNNITGDDD